ncbi:NAD-dependent epimerase/dehydratase family protein [Alterisphingorhabdus coralli]|uniref:NAD-dependent epimerase/dehydratase family protein n=1 Tax=Alterisphingorhabdus coralli TaxID=3071408 RepID=A0AA97HZM5_9SPHN|nr:NAD-dependent epimerase/dehydratase family protein [Parasphingorhabdus sp. SCSIO 66989]WOE73997.1 NAD-dependent epimerase/dehydratase family protein [Parasphingorhabdus sp. SCSIO 66989]
MTEQRVLVTGGTGYIGGELIDQLLKKGWAVNTTVRSKAKSESRLRNRWPDAGDRLQIFEADLMSDSGWAEANQGCTHVAHVASPFPMAVPSNADELIVPAREGTLRALRFAKDAGVTRFVQTSSAAAIAYGHGGAKTLFDQNDWTNLDAPNVAPYIQSKTVAERAARDWVLENAPEMEFCSVNPVAVLGPVENDDLSTSVEMIKMLMDGSVPLIPNMGIGVVDVRDVAKTHLLALEAPAETVNGERFPASQSFLWMADMAATLRQRVPEHAKKVPTGNMPDFLVKILALFMAEMKQVKGELGNLRDVDGSHTTKTLGFDYIPAEQSIEDTARSLVAHGIIKG